VKATLINKIGANFKINVPDYGFLVKNVIFDGIDSVLDGIYSDLLKILL
jgi:hypothetical protein